MQKDQARLIMDKERSLKLLAEIRDNRRKLDNCARHLFILGEPPYALGAKICCSNCGGSMGLTDANQYARGYMAAGKNPDEVIPGFYGPDFNHEVQKATCPKCKGVCGSEQKPGDWFDCDFCEGSGEVNRIEALLYLDAKPKAREL